MHGGMNETALQVVHQLTDDCAVRAHLQELADIVEDAPSPQHRLHNAAEVVILQTACGIYWNPQSYTPWSLSTSSAPV